MATGNLVSDFYSSPGPYSSLLRNGIINFNLDNPMRKNINFADVITYDNLGKFGSTILGGRRPLISVLPCSRSTMHVNNCFRCKRKRIDGFYFCYNHLKKNKKNIIKSLMNEHALSLRSPIDREQIKYKISRIKELSI